MNTINRMTYIILLLAVSIVALYSPVSATGSDDSTAKENYLDEVLERFQAKEVRADFLVPTSPAFSVLGVTPEEVVRPDTPKALGAALLNGIDPLGNMQSGVALDFAPFYLFKWRDLSLKKYRDNPYVKYLSRLQVSIGTVKGINEDESARLSTGFRLSLVNKADPRLSTDLDDAILNMRSKFEEIEKLENEYDSAYDEVARIDRSKAKIEYEIEHPEQQTDIGKLKKKLETLESEMQKAEKKMEEVNTKRLDKRKAAWKKANEEFEKTNWNATNFTLGFAPVFFSEEGNLGNLESSGYCVYASFAYGFEHFSKTLHKNAQFIIHSRYRTKEQIADPDDGGVFFEQDSYLIGAQVRIAGPDFGEKVGGEDLGFFGELDYRIVDRVEEEDDDSVRFALGMEIKVSENTTLSLIIGNESGDDVTQSSGFTVGSLKWAF